jgi:hypothetical protein
MSYETDLKSVLQNKSLSLYGQLPRIEKVARSVLCYTQGKFPYYTPHDFSHSLNVEDHLNWVIPDSVKERMAAEEIFFLIIAAWMHDWGMVGSPGEEPQKIREEHHLRTEKYFEEMYDKLFLSEKEGQIIGRICRGHTKEDLFKEDYNPVIFGNNVKIRRRFLSALLRIADECDITHNRTPEIIYFSLNPTGKSEEEFKKHMAITGIGQLDPKQKYKIDISAIARDPKGAKTLRDVRDKIQNELNSVKGILAQESITLDIVELKLETKGFIDRPIGFEVDRKKIVDLLIGEHLYANSDVAIRELAQNAIDSCKAMKTINPQAILKIVLRKNENTIEVEDDGVGMDYATAKKFLSVIGTSYYKTEDFKELIKGEKFEPISKFGIGILSCFLISNGIVIETKREGQEPCKFTISSLDEDWRYEKGSLEKSGTKIVLNLNDEGRKIDLLQSLKRYIVASDIPIFYQDNGMEATEYQNAWSFSAILERFVKDNSHGQLKSKVKPDVKELLKWEDEEYQVILGQTGETIEKPMILFSHGIFVNGFDIDGLSYGLALCINAKKDLFDLHISRENVSMNSRWQDFQFGLYSKIFRKIRDYFLNNDKASYVNNIIRLIGYNYSLNFSTKEEELHFLSTFNNYPLIRSAVAEIFFPVLSRGRLEFLTLPKIENTHMVLFYLTSRNPFKEIEVVSRLMGANDLTIFDPYFERLNWQIVLQNKDYFSLIGSILRYRGKTICEKDLSVLIIDKAVMVDQKFGELVPPNFKLVKFPNSIKPLVIYSEKPIILVKEYSFGSAYYGNILLWQTLIKEKADLKELELGVDYLNDIELVSEPTILIDSEDEFIRQVLSSQRNKTVDQTTSEKIKRYFTHLKFLPLAVYNLTSCVVFLDVLDNLEKEIAKTLGFDPPQFLLKRIDQMYLQAIRTRNVPCSVIMKDEKVNENPVSGFCARE